MHSALSHRPSLVLTAVQLVQITQGSLTPQGSFDPLAHSCHAEEMPSGAPCLAFCNHAPSPPTPPAPGSPTHSASALHSCQEHALETRLAGPCCSAWPATSGAQHQAPHSPCLFLGPSSESPSGPHSASWVSMLPAPCSSKTRLENPLARK